MIARTLSVTVAALLSSLVMLAHGEEPKPWCAPELETLERDVCFHAEPAKEGRRSLVIFLHGLVQKGAGWQHAQQRGIVRGAKRLGFSVLTPRGRAGHREDPNMVAWPTRGSAQRSHEDELLTEWKAARTTIEERQGASFDEVFVVGFSNGAYYASSLAMRGRLDVDGYAVFAGGSAYGVSAAEEQRVPVFVGICGKDSTAEGGRSLVQQLKKHRWPHRAETRQVGHTIADVHLDHALGFLREK